MICIQERLFERSEMAVSVRAFVRGRLEGFALRQAARAEKWRRQRQLRASAADARTRDMQTCFGFDLESLLEHARTHEWTPEERRAQVISFAYGNVKLHNPAITREDVERIYEQLIPVTA